MAFSNHDIVPDSPTNNFATFNPLADLVNSTATFSNGNLRIFNTSNQLAGLSTISYPLKGKYYSEFSDIALGDISYRLVVIYNNTTGKRVELAMDGSWTNEAGTRTNGYLPSFSSSDVAGFWVDLENGEYAFSKNGSFGDTKQFDSTFYANGVSASSADSVVFRFQGTGTIASWGITVNTGQDPTFGGTKTPSGGTNSDGSYPDKSDTGIGGFFYEPPAGALALCTANLPEMTPDVDGDFPQDYFKALKYTGNGGTQSITGVGFQPDLVWSKSISHGDSHALINAVRGGDKSLYSNAAVAENAYAADTATITFDSDGFSFTEGGLLNNRSGGSFVAWCWKAGGAGVTNTNGTFTSTVSANQDAGFSIVEFVVNATTGTVGHGLSSTPDIIITKGTGDWWTAVDTITGTQDDYLALSLTNGVRNLGSTFPFGRATSSVFYVSDAFTSNPATVIAYCWHSVEGYSKFGSYTGNGSADGPFVYTGFRPAFVMVKRTDSEGSWVLHDTARNPYNVSDNDLYANLSDAEITGIRHDSVSNGFKVRNSFTNTNESGGTYIYMAFAEQPFNYANAR